MPFVTPGPVEDVEDLLPHTPSGIRSPHSKSYHPASNYKYGEILVSSGQISERTIKYVIIDESVKTIVEVQEIVTQAFNAQEQTLGPRPHRVPFVFPP